MLATTRNCCGDLARYTESRRQLGAPIPSGDPVADAALIAEALGPRSYAYVQQMLDELAEAWPTDPDGARIDYAAVVARLDRFGGRP